MGNVTLATFYSDLTFDLRNRNDAASQPTAQLSWINAGLSWMCQPNIHRHRELGLRYDAITLVTGDNEYDLSAATVGRRVNGFRFVTHYLAATITPTALKRKLRWRSHQWFEERTNHSGAPTNYTLDGDVLVLYGVPTTTENGQRLRVGYWAEPTPFDGTDTTLTTEVAPYFDRVLRKISLAFALEDLGARDLALEARQEAVSLVNELPDNDQENDTDTGQAIDIEGGPRMLA